MEGSKASKGSHTLQCKAYDAAGNLGTRPACSFTASRAEINPEPWGAQPHQNKTMTITKIKTPQALASEVQISPASAKPETDTALPVPVEGAAVVQVKPLLQESEANELARDLKERLPDSEREAISAAAGTLNEARVRALLEE